MDKSLATTETPAGAEAAPSGTSTAKPVRRHQCAYCGEDMGVWDRRYCDRNDTCGKRECERFARDSMQAERDEAHEQLDRDMGWY